MERGEGDESDVIMDATHAIADDSSHQNEFHFLSDSPGEFLFAVSSSPLTYLLSGPPQQQEEHAQHQHQHQPLQSQAQVIQHQQQRQLESAMSLSLTADDNNVTQHEHDEANDFVEHLDQISFRSEEFSNQSFPPTDDPSLNDISREQTQEYSSRPLEDVKPTIFDDDEINLGPSTMRDV
jgi:hypothetical protein